MKMTKRVIFVPIFLVLLFFGTSWALYVNKQPINLPYFDNGDASWSSFYTRFYINGKPLDLDSFKKRESWFSASLTAMSEGQDYSMEKRLYNRLQNISEAQVALDIEAGIGRALVVFGNLKGRSRCLILRYLSKNGDYVLVDSSDRVVHGVAGVIANQCNRAGEFSVQRASFFDFLFYDVFRCFSSCATKQGIVFKDKISEEKENRFIKTLRMRLANDEREFQSIERGADDIKIELESVIASEKECFLRFTYDNPVLGELSRFAYFDCVSEELIDIDYAGGVAYYFFML